MKWPNDVWIERLKVSGMLVNFDGKTGGVGGIGLNVNQDSQQLKASGLQATSLRSSLGRVVSRERMLALICNNLEELMQLDQSSVVAEYNRCNMLDNMQVRVHHATREQTDPRDYDAMVLGVAANGMLRVQPVGTAGQEAEVMLSGEEISISPLSHV